MFILLSWETKIKRFGRNLKLYSDTIFLGPGLGSVEKVLEMVTDASITMLCKFQLARRDTTLKQCVPQLYAHDMNRFKRSGFISADIFSPAI